MSANSRPMPKIFKSFLFLILPVLLNSCVHAASYFEDEPVVSTQPIGSPYYRHLAQEMNMDLRELVRYEKRGFGRSEIVMLIYISSATGKPLKEYGQRRLKEKVTLRDLAAEAHLDYEDLLKRAQGIKKRIEFLGAEMLPPPVYEVAASTAPVSKPPKPKKEKKKKNP